MSELYFSFFLLLSIVLGLGRIFKGPTPANGILAVQLSGTGGAAILLILPGTGAHHGALIDVALVVALLAAATQIAFIVIHGSTAGLREERRHD